MSSQAMMSGSGRCVLLAAAGWAFLLAPTPGRAADPAPPAAPSAAYLKIVNDYMNCKSDEVEALQAELKKSNRELALKPAEEPDVNYVRQALAESRPAWWNVLKSGKKQPIHPAVFDRTLNATFDPTLKGGVSLTSVGGQQTLLVNWPADDLDNPAQAEHGFSKGELAELGIWGGLAQADIFVTTPMATLADKNPNAVALVNRYMNFRATLTGTYYGLPRVRRWALFLSVLWHLDKYDNDPARMSRKAIASMLVAEVVEHRQKYPSINLPDEVPSENTESKLALQIKDWIETHGWTLAEDRSLREAIKKFALANTRNVLQTGKVTLANGLFVNLDPDRDAPECAKRDAWLRTAWAKSSKPAKSPR